MQVSPAGALFAKDITLLLGDRLPLFTTNYDHLQEMALNRTAVGYDKVMDFGSISELDGRASTIHKLKARALVYTQCTRALLCVKNHPWMLP
jgi:hypothetical protein